MKKSSGIYSHSVVISLSKPRGSLSLAPHGQAIVAAQTDIGAGGAR